MNLIWLVIGVLILVGCYFGAKSILFVSNEQPTIVGGMLLVKKGALLAKPPIFEWIGEEKSGSRKGVLSVQLVPKAGSVEGIALLTASR